MTNKKPRNKPPRKTEAKQIPLTVEPEETTISLGRLKEQLQTLKHEIDIETVQMKIKQHEVFFQKLGDDTDALLDMIRWFKENINHSTADR